MSGPVAWQAGAAVAQAVAACAALLATLVLLSITSRQAKAAEDQAELLRQQLTNAVLSELETKQRISRDLLELAKTFKTRVLTLPGSPSLLVGEISRHPSWPESDLAAFRQLARELLVIPADLAHAIVRDLETLNRFLRDLQPAVGGVAREPKVSGYGGYTEAWEAVRPRLEDVIARLLADMADDLRGGIPGETAVQ